MADFAGFLAEFKERLKVKNYSPMSVTAYCQHVAFFLAHLKETGITDIARVTEETVTAYLAGLHVAAATLALKLRSIKRFFAFLEETNRVLINPTEYIKEPRKESRLPRTILTAKEIQTILNQPNLGTLKGIRDRTILEVFYSTGIRLEELVNLTIYDIDLQGGMLRVNKGKYAKDRVVPMGRHAIAFLREYIAKVRPRLTKGKQVRSLFVNRYREPLSKQMVRIMVRNYAEDAGITKKVTPHTFRHTFATTLLRNGADIVAVQKMLGHARLSNTQIYTQVAGSEVKTTHALSHPREKDPADADKPETKKKFRRPFKRRNKKSKVRSEK